MITRPFIEDMRLWYVSGRTPPEETHDILATLCEMALEGHGAWELREKIDDLERELKSCEDELEGVRAERDALEEQVA